MAEPHCFVSHQSGECRSDLDCTGGIISDTEEISENRNCHDNRIAAWAAGNKYTAEKLGVPAKALCCHTPAECACNGCRLVVPSGHSTSSMAAALVIFCRTPRKIGIPAIILGVSICLSRLYVGVHYPSDVVCGALIGVLAALCALKITKDRKEKQAVG